MRIAYIVQARMPTEKAHGLQIAHMCAAFTSLGHKLTLVVPKRKNPITEDLFLYYGIGTHFPVVSLWSPDLVSNFGRFGPLVHYLHSALFLVRLLFFRPGPDTIIYTRNPEIAWLYSFRGYRVICEVHDWPESHAGLFSYFLRRVDLIPCNSVGTERACRAHGLNRTIVAQNGIDVEAFSKRYDKKEERRRLGIPLEKKVVMYIGSLEKWKGVETLCEAALAFPNDVLAVVIGGTSKQIEALKSRYAQVLFLGLRPYRELPGNQATADILVVPNIPESTESTEYTSPIKLFAHMASNIPIIVSDLPSLRAIVDESMVWFVPPASPPELFRMSVEVLRGQDANKIRTERAREVVSAFSWETRARTILENLGSD